MCRYGHPDCVGEAEEAFHVWMEAAEGAENPINPDLRATVYRTVIGDGGEVIYFLYWYSQI